MYILPQLRRPQMTTLCCRTRTPETHSTQRETLPQLQVHSTIRQTDGHALEKESQLISVIIFTIYKQPFEIRCTLKHIVSPKEQVRRSKLFQNVNKIEPSREWLQSTQQLHMSTPRCLKPFQCAYHKSQFFTKSFAFFFSLS